MKNINSVFTFTNDRELIEEYFDTSSFSDDFLFFLDHVNDFESLAYMVLNGETVLVYEAGGGPVYGSMTLDEFYRSSLEAYQEQLDE